MSATMSPQRGSGSLDAPRPRAPRTRQRNTGRVVRGTLSVLWIAVRVAIIAICLAIVVAWRGFDVTPLGIVSGSMAPTIPTNSLIFVERVKPSSIREGDVITFDPPGPTPRVTHRVMEREQINGLWYFETKGDANDAMDDWRTSDSATQSRGVTYESRDALRVVWDVPEIGRIAKLTEHTALRMTLVFGALGGILVLLLVRIWRSEDSIDNKVERP